VQTFLEWKSSYITCSASVFVALGIRHALRMQIIVICRLPALQHFSTLSHGFQRRDIEQDLCVLIFSTSLFETF
jgi:hypothetical protein